MRIHHVALRTRDLARLERFYVATLGLEVVRRDDARGSVWLGAGDAVLMLELAAPTEPAVPEGSLDLLAFAMEDAPDAMAAWRSRVAVEAETANTLYFRDPDGRRVAVSRYPLPAR